MKKFLFISLLFIANFSFSQDTISMRSGKVVIAKISEVSPTAVRYKEFSMPDGPDFVVDKQTIKKIVYKNGTTEMMEEPPVVKSAPVPVATPPQQQAPEVNSKFVQVGKRYTYNGAAIGETRMYRIMDKKNDPELYSITKKAKRAKGLQFIGFAAIPAGIYAIETLVVGSLFSDFAPLEQNAMYAVSAVAGVATVGLTVTGLVFNARHQKLKAKAVKLYNEKY